MVCRLVAGANVNLTALADRVKYGGVAQLGEHLPCKQGVRSSILLISTIAFALQMRKHRVVSAGTLEFAKQTELAARDKT